MKTKIYSTLPKCAMDIREAVFIREQGFENEFDEIDNRAIHFVLFSEENIPVGVCRVYKSEDKTDDCYILGRLAVIKEFRGQNLGAELVGEAEKWAASGGGKSITLHAQCRVREFYEKLGYSVCSEMDYDEDCPHVWMKKDL
jgi:predicted GNAT family N-acyltransferase